MKNLSQELKRKRDAEARLRQTDPAKSIIYSGDGSTGAGGGGYVVPADLLNETAHDALDHTGITGCGGDPSPLTTKGDIYTYGSADARLAAGTNNKVLQAASGETTGLKWVQNTRGIAYCIAGALTTSLKAFFTAPCAMTVTGGKLEIGTACTGAALICDIHKNGTTLFTTQGNRPTIADAGTSAAITAPDVTSIAAGDRIELDIDQIGSTVAGSDLSLTLYCEVV